MVLKVSRQSHVVIYITGLNDRTVKFQKFAVSTWWVFGVQPILFQTNWANSESFSQKLDRLLNLIDEKNEYGQVVSLVAASAGASLAVAAYARRTETINGAAFICGKLRNPQTVGASYYLQNPAFREAMSTLNDNLASLTSVERARIMSISPLLDKTVVVKDTFVTGAKNVKSPTLFHVLTIALGITLFSFLPIIFLKRLQKGRIEA